MAQPVIKAYIVPVGYEPNGNGLPTDVVTCSSRNATLIERMTDTSKTGGSGQYLNQNLILMSPSGVSRVYSIDYDYHDESSSRNFADTSNTSFLTSVTKGGTIIPKKEFASQRSDSLPAGLMFQVFISKQNTYLGYSNYGGTSEPYTYVPQQGGYSSNIPGDLGSAQSPWFGKQQNISLCLPLTIDDSNSDLYAVNYTIDPDAKTITFSETFYNNFVILDSAELPSDPSLYEEIDEGIYAYKVYIRGYVKITDNTPSDVWVASNSSYLYYVLEHDDLVASQTLTVECEYNSVYTTDVTTEVYFDTGIISVAPKTTLPYYPTNVRFTTDFTYHTWDRITNDDVLNIQMHGLLNSDTRYEDDGDITLTDNGIDYPYNLTGNEARLPLHEDLNADGYPTTSPRWYWAWSDIKVVNEGETDLTRVLVRPIPRGVLESGAIKPYSDGLLNLNRCWDHQEGIPDETYNACFTRATKTWLWVDEEWDLRKDRVDNIGKWYDSLPTHTVGEQEYAYFVLPTGADDLDRDSIDETDKPVTIDSSNPLYVRIVHTLKDPNSESMNTNDAGGKCWSLEVIGEYTEEGS